MIETILVVASTHDQFISWCHKNEEKPKTIGGRALYASTLPHIMGYKAQSTAYVMVGLYTDETYHLVQEIRARGIPWFEDPHVHTIDMLKRVLKVLDTKDEDLGE